MFYNIENLQGAVLLAIGFFIFALIVWRVPLCAAALVLFLSPLYILKVKIGFLPLTVLDLLVIVLGGVWLIRRLCAGRRGLSRISKTSFGVRNPQNKFWRPDLFCGNALPVFLILFGAWLSAVFSEDWRVSFGILKSWFFLPIIFGLLLLDLIKIKEQFRKIPAAIFFSAVAVALAGVYYLLAGRLTFDGRLSAFYLSPNQLAMSLAPGLILSVFFWFEAKKKWEKILLFAAGCLLSVILYFTYSYGAWLAILAALGYAWIVFWRGKELSKRNLYFVLCALFLMAAFIFLAQMKSAKVVGLLFDGRSSWQSRLMIWQAAWLMAKDHWFLGIGPGMFQNYYLSYQKYFAVPYLEWAVPQPHNLFLAFWLQTGLIGLAGFLLLVFNFFRNNRAFWRQTKEPLILALAALMIYFLAHGLVDTSFWKNDLSLVFFTVVFLNHKASRLFC